MRKKSLAVLFAGIFGISVSTFSPNARAVQPGNYSIADKRPSIVAMGLDFLVVRPLTFALTVGGGVFWFLTLPVSAIGGNAGEARDKLFLEPARYTFVRPLGHMQLDNPSILGKDEKKSSFSADR
ncbi:MAG: hypothetical protein ACRESZ_19665 [Methylococcales bacterium]